MMPLVLFFSLAYLFSWVIWLPLYGPSFGIKGLPVLPFHHGLGGLGPLLSAFVTTYLLKSRKGVKELWTHSFKLRPAVYLLIALFSPYVLTAVAAVGSYFLYHTPVNLKGMGYSREFPDFNLLEWFGYNLLFFGWGEEVGWRGFALPRFQQHFNALGSSLMLTVFWAVWHWPAFFYRPGYTSMDPAGVFGWVFSLLTGSVLLTWLYNSSKGSILICAVFHSAIDIVFTSESSNAEMTNLMGFLITLWGVLTILIFKPKNLSLISKTKAFV
ncbi:MAG: CPBP family intramembrane glutamic endopeptidase [Spirosomataceae bacterium]